MELNAIWS